MSHAEDFDETLMDLVDRFSKIDIASDDAAKAATTIVTFSKARPADPEPEPEPIHVPTTWREKAMARASAVLDNETTRTLIKAGGAFAGVGLVVWSTVHRDHVVERQALQQANQRSI